MNIQKIRDNAFSMPYTCPSYPKGPYRFTNREYFIISYLTDLDALQAVVPEPLTVTIPIVRYEFIRMPDSSGFGNYTECGQVIAVVDANGVAGSYTHSMYLDDEAPIAAGREIWGFPKRLAAPKLEVCSDTLLGTLMYGPVCVARGTMGYKYERLDTAAEASVLAGTPNYLLKIIPHVDGSARICELVRFYLRDVTVTEAWSGPAALDLFQHALAPVASLPVRKILGAKHLVSNLTLGYGEVVYDYLADH